MVKVPDPKVTLPPEGPDKLPIVLLYPAKSIVAPLAMVIAESTPNAPEVPVETVPAWRVPAVMFVGPV